jgi:hypothetical protein
VLPLSLVEGPDVTGQAKIPLPAAAPKIDSVPVRTLVEKLTAANAAAIWHELSALLDAP